MRKSYIGLSRKIIQTFGREWPNIHTVRYDLDLGKWGVVEDKKRHKREVLLHVTILSSLI